MKAALLGEVQKKYAEMHKREVDGINRMELELAQIIRMGREEETKGGEEPAKRERKWAGKVESKFGKAIKESGGASAKEEGAGPESITEGATNSDIDMSEEVYMSPCAKYRPTLSRISTATTQQEVNDQVS
jgi:hypothetical protein